MNTPELQDLIESSRTILLIDWPNIQLPYTLLQQGFEVYGRSPGGYNKAEFLTEAPPDGNSIAVSDENSDKGFIKFHKLQHGPDQVDIIHIFRPAEELKHLIEAIVIPLRPKVLWLQPPVTSDEARQLALDAGVAFVQGIEIIDVIDSLNARK
jgi:hypothetical protein